MFIMKALSFTVWVLWEGDSETGFNVYGICLSAGVLGNNVVEGRQRSEDWAGQRCPLGQPHREL